MASRVLFLFLSRSIICLRSANMSSAASSTKATWLNRSEVSGTDMMSPDNHHDVATTLVVQTTQVLSTSRQSPHRELKTNLQIDDLHYFNKEVPEKQDYFFSTVYSMYLSHVAYFLSYQMKASHTSRRIK